MCGVVKTMLATALNRTQREWNMFLGASQYAVNSAYQSSNKWSPAFLMFGRQLRLPIEQALSAEPTAYSAELDDLVTQLKERQYDAITQVIDNQKAARAYQKKRYDQRARDRHFEIGDLVYRHNPSVAPGNASKLTRKWIPGYVVVGRHENGLTYDVRKPGSRDPPESVHCNRLKPQPVSHVYREATAKTKPGVFRRTQDTPKRKAAVGPESNARGRTEEPSPEDSTEPGIPRLLHRTPKTADAHSDTDSGVTNVLEALGPTEGRSERDSSHDEAGGDDERESDDSDSRYATIPALPAATHQRLRRNRRPPDRYVP